MPEFKTQEDVERWLKTREPLEITLFAARAALRILPEMENDQRAKMPTLLLPAFRSMAASWVASLLSEPDMEIAHAARNAALMARFIIDDGILGRGSPPGARDPNNNASIHVIIRGNAAAEAAHCALTQQDRGALSNATQAVRMLSDRFDVAIHARGLIADANTLESGASVAEFSAMPLWPDGRVPEVVATAWNRIKSRLPEGEHWDVWTTWYEDRRRGAPADLDLEKARVVIPDGDWKRGAAHINGIVKYLSEETRKTGKVPTPVVKGLWAWLGTRRSEEVALIAARAALRVLPALAMEHRENAFFLLLLPAFRTTAQAWVAGTGPDLITKVAFRPHNRFVSTAEATKFLINPINFAAEAASDAATHAANAAANATAADLSEAFPDSRATSATTDAANATSLAISVADMIVALDPDAFPRPFKDLVAEAETTDTATLERGGTALELSAMPLWPNGKAPETMTTLWSTLKSRLPENNDWDVWTTWYEARLRGTSADMELENARVLIPDEDWEKGAAHVNAIIKRLIAEHGETSHTPELKTREDIKNWLNARRSEEAILLAARAVLRILPALTMIEREYVLPDILLPVFRAASVPWVSGTWPDTNPEVVNAAFQAQSDANIASSLISAAFGDQSDAKTADNIANAAKTAARIAYKFTLKHYSRTGADAVMDRVGAFYAPAIETFSDDANAIRNGATVLELSAKPLWPEGRMPEEMAAHWDRLKSRLPEGEDWDVWTTWYEDRLRGTCADKELEKARVLIPDEDWEQGPVHVNAIIKRLIAEHRTHPLAEADFRYNPNRNAMEMVPFEDDIASFDSEAARKHLSDELEDLHKACSELAGDIEDEKRQIQLSFCRDLTRYGEETARGHDGLRPGTLRRLGEALVRGAADENLRHGLGDYLCPKLDDIIARHLRLLARFHEGMLARMKPLSDAELTESPEEADKRIGEVMETIDSDAWRALLPSVPDEFPDMVATQREHLRAMAAGINLKLEGEARMQATRAVKEGYIRLIATIMRLGVRTLEAVGENKAIAGAMTLVGIITLLLTLIG